MRKWVPILLLLAPSLVFHFSEPLVLLSISRACCCYMGPTHLGALVGGEAQDSNWQLVLVGTDTGPLAVATSDGCIGGSVLSWRLCKRLGWTLAPQTLTAPAAQGLPKGWLFCRCIVHFKGARDREEGKGRVGVVGSQEQALGGTRYLPKAKP